MSSSSPDALPTAGAERRRLFGPIRRGQWWVKEDSGHVMQIKSAAGGSRWRVLRATGGVRSHVVEAHDIYRFYRPLKLKLK